MSDNLNCLKNSIAIIYIIKSLGCLGLLAIGDFLSIFINFIIFISFSLSAFWAYKGINQKMFNLYKRALIISFIISVVSSIVRIISIISIISYDAGTKEEKLAKKLALAFYIIGFFFDWILTILLLLYKKKVENFCESGPFSLTLSTNNIPQEIAQPNELSPENKQ